jgi:hypothetical protein
MKKLILISLLSFVSLSSFSAIKTLQKVDLKINLQRLDLKAQDFRLILPENKTASIKKEVNNETKTITAKAVKLDNETYKVELIIIEMGKVIATPQVTVKNNTEALYQTFDSEGNSDLKLIIKID